MQGVSIHEINGFAFRSPRVFSNPETFLPEKGYTAAGICRSLSDEAGKCYSHPVTD